MRLLCVCLRVCVCVTVSCAAVHVPFGQVTCLAPAPPPTSLLNVCVCKYNVRADVGDWYVRHCVPIVRVAVLRLDSRSNHFIRGVTTSESGRQRCCAPAVCVWSWLTE